MCQTTAAAANAERCPDRSRGRVQEDHDQVPEAPPKTAALPGVKELVSLRIDQDVLEYFQEGGPGWQDRINDALRKAAGK